MCTKVQFNQIILPKVIVSTDNNNDENIKKDGQYWKNPFFSDSEGYISNNSRK